MKISVLFLLVFFGIYCVSQNLVPNPGFENYGPCPEDFIPFPKKNLVKEWNMPSKGTADYFNRCSKKNAGVPINFAGAVQAHSGDAYIGIILREHFNENMLKDNSTNLVYREYAQAKLTIPLEAGKTYCVQLYYSHAGNSQYAVDRLGICLSNNSIGVSHDGVIGSKPQIFNTPGKFMNNAGMWTPLCDTYTAVGDEQFITIGNFWFNDETKFERMDLSGITKPIIQAYYFIDDVSVIEISDPKDCECAKSDEIIQTDTEIDFEKAVEGESIILQNIFFDIDKAILLPESHTELNKLLSFMNKYPEMEIEISGHTSNTGTPEHNLDLSNRRAKAVADFLIEKGIVENRIKSLGYGLTKPIASNETKEGRSKNRRVEFKIIRK
ncbi:MAG: OmpA family protein [Bacteroidota bacterium]